MAERQVIETGVSADDAVPLLERAMASYRERFATYEPSFAWTGKHEGRFGFRALGADVDGKIALTDGACEVTLDVPWRLKPFRKKALEVIEREVRHWISQEASPPG
jgi:hypothetical protein